MGGLIPIGGGADAEIKDKLNAAFNDTNIVIVRGIVANENLFDQQHHLHRVAYRLGAYPIRTYTGDSAQAKGKSGTGASVRSNQTRPERSNA